MKKTFLGTALVCASTVLLPMTSFAATSSVDANPASTTTPVSANFTLSNGTNNNPTNEGTSGEQNKNNNPAGPFGIAYQPAEWTTGSVALNESGKQDISFTNTDAHVGVKDKTHDTQGWTLTAQLKWNSDDLAGSTIVAEEAGEVKNNISTTSSNIQLEATTSAENTSQTQSKCGLTINDSATTVMTGKSGVQHNATYDYKIGQAKLSIPDVSKVKAGSHSGTVTWTLTKAV